MKKSSIALHSVPKAALKNKLSSRKSGVSYAIKGLCVKGLMPTVLPKSFRTQILLQEQQGGEFLADEIYRGPGLIQVDCATE